MSKELAQEKAADAVRELIDDIVDDLVESGEADTQINARTYGQTGEELENAFGEEEFYQPSEAIEVLEELDEYEETDSGLWEGIKGWKDQLRAVAAYTFRNACTAFFRELVEQINSDIDVEEIKEEIREKMKEHQRPVVELQIKEDQEEDGELDEKEVDAALDEWIEEAKQDTEITQRARVLIQEKVKEIADDYHA